MSPKDRIDAWLETRLEAPAREWAESARAEIAGGVDVNRFCALLSMASRHARGRDLEPTAEECRAAAEAVPGWNPERWTLLETLRVSLILARPDLDSEAGAKAIDEAYRFADEGETCALSRSLPLLPDPERFLWRAGECCRTNMLSVFEATVLDSPYPARFFDEKTFNQAAVKALFIGVPLWRLHGLDGRLSEDLAVMALDLAEERRSAHREVQPELWLCVGTHGGDRAVESLVEELQSGAEPGRRAAAYGLVRAGQSAGLEPLLGSLSGEVANAARDALAGNTSQGVFAPLAPQVS